VGGTSADSLRVVGVDKPPTPDPSPPLRGGRGEDSAGNEAGEALDVQLHIGE
jgi:hypothetical protein